jgi:hypothetical protein
MRLKSNLHSLPSTVCGVAAGGFLPNVQEIGLFVDAEITLYPGFETGG